VRSSASDRSLPAYVAICRQQLQPPRDATLIPVNVMPAPAGFCRKAVASTETEVSAKRIKVTRAAIVRRAVGRYEYFDEDVDCVID
jgi:hypothetical protein